MKKIILLLAILSVGIISSCSKDDENNAAAPVPTPDDVFTAKVNDVPKVFKVSDVKVLEYPLYTDIEITAYLVNDPSITFELNFNRDSGEVYFAQYLETGNYYQPSAFETFPLMINENSTGKLRGTFSGPMEHTAHSLNPITVTDGFFEIYY